MPDTIEGRLRAAADATDAMVAGWADAADLPSVRAARRVRGARKLLYPALSAAAVAAVVATAVAVTGSSTSSSTGTAPAGHRTAAGGPALGSGATVPPPPAAGQPAAPPPTAPPPTAPPAADPPARAQAFLTGQLPGLRDLTRTWFTNGSYVIEGGYWPGGAHLATVTLTVQHEANPSTGSPCVLPEGATAGRQGAPAPDDVCTPRPQPDGTVVWIWRMGHSPYRPWTTADTKDWRVSQVRRDGTVVTLEVTSMIGNQRSGTPIYAGTPFDIPAGTLVRLVASPQLALAGACTHDCTRFPGPPPQR